MVSKTHPHAGASDPAVRRFIKALTDLPGRRGRRERFEGFLDAAFASLWSASLRTVGRDPSPAERIYHDALAWHDDVPPETFAALFAHLVQALENDLRDVMAEICNRLDLLNTEMGQFFTPFDMSLLMARLQMEDVGTRLVRDNEILTLNEPACGAGGMLIAARNVLIEHGCDPAGRVFACATDRDFRCVQMTFIQTTLVGLPTVVYYGDALEGGTGYPNLFAWRHMHRVLGSAEQSALPAHEETADPAAPAKALEPV